MKSTVDTRRIRNINNKGINEGPILYWMSRDQRVHDNWALLYTQQLAKENNRPFGVVFCLLPEFLSATKRQYNFMLKGLMEIEKELSDYQIPFVLLLGDSTIEIPKYVNELNVGALTTDFSPLKIKKTWIKKIDSKINCKFIEVDAHNIVPCWEASPKLEFGAYTLRPKINRVLFDYLTEFMKIEKQTLSWPDKVTEINWKEIMEGIKVNDKVNEVEWIRPGEKEAHLALEKFIDQKLDHYEEMRNNPNLDFQSNISPYLHFGQISAQRIALESAKSKESDLNTKAYLEELIIRRELSDNFCYYNENYDSFEGFQNWAKLSLNEHKKDKREYIYNLEEFEDAKTHDDLWNAAQKQMIIKGKMHGFMRMYWAKKILEWTPTPEDALKIAIYLNDKYELDGRDPNGYAGIAWSIGGTHDRAWFDRPVFGKIRYMNYNGCKSKFDVEKYINTYLKDKP